MADNLMRLNRREWLHLSIGGLATGLGTSAAAQAASIKKIKAISFDAFAIFDQRPVAALAEALFPGRGGALSEAWRTRRFEYAWLRTLTGRYADFWRVTEDALIYAGKALKLDLTEGRRETLMQAYLRLPPWPDAVPAVRALKDSGFRLALLSNFTLRMLEAGVQNGDLDGVFEHSLSTDTVHSYKPTPRAYHMAIDAFGLNHDEILFVAFAGWDAAGARSFGYRTFWLNRLSAPAEELDKVPDATGNGFADLLAFVSR